jgi:diaminohydroxyphosphoribosylaminopyrimidine deaminase/5-amino-6-(5-phosphoribosylamino)uracil reductase
MTTEFAPAERIENLRQAGVEVLIVAASSQRQPDLSEVARELGRRRMTNVLIEAGSQVLGSFFDHNLVNEVHAFIAPKLVGGHGAPSPIGGIGIGAMTRALHVGATEVQILDGDVYLRGDVALPAESHAVL